MLTVFWYILYKSAESDIIVLMTGGVNNENNKRYTLYNFKASFAGA